MDLSYSPRYEAFRREVRGFLEENRDRASSAAIVLRIGERNQKAIDWQRILIENATISPTVPLTGALSTIRCGEGRGAFSVTDPREPSQRDAIRTRTKERTPSTTR